MPVEGTGKPVGFAARTPTTHGRSTPNSVRLAGPPQRVLAVPHGRVNAPERVLWSGRRFRSIERGTVRASTTARAVCPRVYSSSPAGRRPARNRITGSSSKSPSSASPVRDQAITPTLICASRSAVRRAACSDLHATDGSARRRVPRPARNDCTMKSVS
jgi:hypothetical protein